MAAASCTPAWLKCLRGRSQFETVYNRLPASPVMSSPGNTLAAIWRAGEHAAEALEMVELTGAEPMLPSSFAVGTLAQTTIAAAALAAGEGWRVRDRRRPRIRVDKRD